MLLPTFFAIKREVDSTNEAFRCEYLNQQDPREFLGPAGRIRYTGGSGHRTCGYYWPAQEAKGVVILVHGHGSYIQFEYLTRQGVGNHKTYEGSWVQALNQAGFSVAGMDNRGCGRSSGLLGYVEDHQIWVDDLLQFTKTLQNSDIQGFAGLPTYLPGCSLGGCLSVLAALSKPCCYAGLILLAPMLSLEKVKRKGINPILLRIAALLNWFIPTWPMVHTNENCMFPELQQDWNVNPCTYHYKTRVRIGVECIRMTDRVMQGMHALECPVFVIHSLKDDMTDPDGSKHLVQVAKSCDKSLKLVDDMWHVLTKEPGNEVLLKDCITWLSARSGAPTAAAAATAAAATAAMAAPGAVAAAAAAATAEAPPVEGASPHVSSGSDGVEGGPGDAWEKVEKEDVAGADST